VTVEVGVSPGIAAGSPLVATLAAADEAGETATVVLPSSVALASPTTPITAKTSVTPTVVTPSAHLTYQFSLTNGGAQSRHVIATLTLDPNVSYVTQFTTITPAPNVSTLQWQFDLPAQGTTGAINVEVAVAASTVASLPLTSVLTVVDDLGGQAFIYLQAATAAAASVAPFAFKSTISPTTAYPGSHVTYGISVTNSAALPHDALVTFALDPQTTFIASSPSPDGMSLCAPYAATCSPVTRPRKGRAVGGRMCTTVTPDAPLGVDSYIYFDARAGSPLAGVTVHLSPGINLALRKRLNDAGGRLLFQGGTQGATLSCPGTLTGEVQRARLELTSICPVGGAVTGWFEAEILARDGSTCTVTGYFVMNRDS
jgi:uncharacterized repeat protein (TIGR01451 family)